MELSRPRLFWLDSASPRMWFGETDPPSARGLLSPYEETGWGQTGILLSVFVPILIAVLAFCPYLYRSSFWAGNSNT